MLELGQVGFLSRFEKYFGTFATQVLCGSIGGAILLVCWDAGWDVIQPRVAAAVGYFSTPSATSEIISTAVNVATFSVTLVFFVAAGAFILNVHDSKRMVRASEDFYRDACGAIEESRVVVRAASKELDAVRETTDRAEKLYENATKAMEHTDKQQAEVDKLHKNLTDMLDRVEKIASKKP